MGTQHASKAGVPKGIRTPVTAVKGRCPRPLDDGDIAEDGFVVWIPFERNGFFQGGLIFFGVWRIRRIPAGVSRLDGLIGGWFGGWFQVFGGRDGGWKRLEGGTVPEGMNALDQGGDSRGGQLGTATIGRPRAGSGDRLARGIFVEIFQLSRNLLWYLHRGMI